MTFGTELATGGKASHPPYNEIGIRQPTFIENKYLPRGMKIRQARNLKQEEIALIFEHIGWRQEKYGAENAFRFKSILRNKETLSAMYPDAVPETEEPGDAEPTREEHGNEGKTPKYGQRQTRGRKAAGAKRPADAEIEHDNEAELGEDNNTGADPINGNQVGCVQIGQDVANQMRTVGFVIPLPCNGPADGAPQYAIPRETYTTFVQQTMASSSKTAVQSGANDNRIDIDPRLLKTKLPTPRPSPTPAPRPMPRPTRIQPTRKGKEKDV